MESANPFDDIRRNLNRHGRRMTPQREAILADLRSRCDHPTAEQIHLSVQERIPRISLGTVYRNLQVLVEEGYALRFPTTRGIHRFDGDVRSHHHIVCRECGRIDDVYIDPDAALRRSVARRTGYRVLGERTEFEGICPACSGTSS